MSGPKAGDATRETKSDVPTFGSPIRGPNESVVAGGLRRLVISWPVRVGVGPIALLSFYAFCLWIAQNVSLVLGEVRGREALQKGNSLVFSRNFAPAIPAYTAALQHQLRPHDRALAYGRRGWAYANLDRDDDAIRDFNAALEIEPNLGFALLDRGLALHRQGKFDEALANYEKTIWLDRNSVDAYRNRALIMAHLGPR